MPCRSGDEEGGHSYWGELQEATQAACEMAKVLRSKDPLFSKLSRSTRDWVKEHDRIDGEREAREMAEQRQKETAAKALKKLSKAEREALRL